MSYCYLPHYHYVVVVQKTISHFFLCFSFVSNKCRQVCVDTSIYFSLTTLSIYDASFDTTCGKFKFPFRKLFILVFYLTVHAFLLFLLSFKVQSKHFMFVNSIALLHFIAFFIYLLEL